MHRFAGVATVLSAFALASPAAGQAAVGDCAGADVVRTPQEAHAFERSTLCLLNAQRSSAGFRALSTRPVLSRAAARYSARMVRESFFAHRDLAGRLARAGYISHAATDWLVGENLAWATGVLATPRQLVAAWMASPGHRRNILEPAFRDIGIGVASGTPSSSPDGVTVTTEFGTRRVLARVRGGSRRDVARH